MRLHHFFLRTIFLILLGFIVCSPVPAQVGSVIKKISKGVVQKTVKKSVKKEAKTYGRNAVEKAAVNHAFKKKYVNISRLR